MRDSAVTAMKAAIMKRLLLRGWVQHHIASLWGINQGRVSEVNTGKNYTGVLPASDAEVDEFLRNLGVA